VRKRPAFYNEANPECDIEACLDILRDSDFGFVHQVLTFTREHSEAESSVNNRLGTSYLASLEHLTKYGRVYLNNSEYEQCVQRNWQQYYSFLGAKALQKSEKGFWDFQRRALGRLGYSISKTKVMRYALAEVFDLTLNPLNTSKKILRKIRTSLL